MTRGYLYSVLLLLCNMVLMPLYAMATPNVVTSIKPVQLLVESVTEGVVKPSLLLSGSEDPHHYQLTPSKALLLEKADIIFYIGEDMERFLSKSVKVLGKNAHVVALIDTKNLTLLPIKKQNNNHHDEEAHSHDAMVDMHIWLSPVNAMLLTQAIADELSLFDPDNKEKYQNNAVASIKEIKDYDVSLRTKLRHYKGTPYLVMHDAYQYFEKHYGLNNKGAVSPHADTNPGARHITKIRDIIIDEGVSCIFTEPQNRSASAIFLAEQLSVNTGILDPIGTTLDQQTPRYIDLLAGLSQNLTKCFLDLRVQ